MQQQGKENTVNIRHNKIFSSEMAVDYEVHIQFLVLILVYWKTKPSCKNSTFSTLVILS